MRAGWAMAVLATLMVVGGCKKEQKKAEPATDKPATDTPPPATDTPPATDKPAPDPALVERGKYMADVMGCMHCHTPFGPNGAPDMNKSWAGGLEVPEKFGTWRSPNITPDPETGIGKWTDEQIVAAVREGKRPDGTSLKPIMPYLFYNVVSDDDAKALVAFLRTVPPVVNKVERATDLKLPDIPAPKPPGEPPGDDPVARGAYFTSLMHCVICHTPPGKDGMPDMGKAFAGGFPMELPFMGKGVLFSSNITPDKKTGIGAYTDEQIVAAIREMKKKDGKPIVGPMAMYQTGWYRLEEEDVKGIVAFLRSLKPIANKVPKSTFKPSAGGPPPAPGGETGKPSKGGAKPDDAKGGGGKADEGDEPTQ
jgi:mono/diheme cytochrome c family protein